MSERKRPSQVAALRVVEKTDAGIIEAAEPGETPEVFAFEETLENWSRSTFAGDEVLAAIQPRTWLVSGRFPLMVNLPRFESVSNTPRPFRGNVKHRGGGKLFAREITTVSNFERER